MKIQTELLFAEIRDEYGDVESASLVETTSQAVVFFRDHGITLDQTQLTDTGWTFTKKVRS